VSQESTTHLQTWIDHLKAGDRSARDELIRHACTQLRNLAGKMMQQYDRLYRWVDIDDVLQSAILRLLRAMESMPINSAQEFFSLAALQIRRELIDMCRHYFGPQGEAANHESVCVEFSSEDDCRPVCEPAATDGDQLELSCWTEFHELVESLPDGERCVFDLIWYHGMTQAEVALILGQSQAKVKRFWVAARQHMREGLGDCFGSVVL
jgi:RNA polymerase sigma factor (sigma-70 family)